MRAVMCRAFGPYEDLRLEEVAPPPLPPDGVRIAVRAAGISFATSLVVAGRYQRKPPLPFTPGTEIAGEVLEVAPGVQGIAPGQRVCAALDWGGQAEQAVARAACVYAIPEALDWPEATLFPLSYPTAYAALCWRGALREGETVLVHGAGGAAGLAAVELASLLGARVIASAGGEAKLAAARARGAVETVDHRREDVRARVRALTGGRGVDLVFDPVGGVVTAKAIRGLAPEGRLLVIGFAGGDIPQIPANLLLLKNVAAIGVNYGAWIGWGPQDDRERHADRVRAMQRALAGWFEAGRLRPAVSHRLPLERFQEAMRMVLERRAVGKVTLVMPGRAS